MKPKFKFQWYQEIYKMIPKIHEEAREAAKELGLEQLRGKIGLYCGSSSSPAALPKYVLDAIIEANKIPVYPLSKVEYELRELVKDLYGDDYDVAVTNTCESALRVSYETLFVPPTMRKGDAYRARYIVPYQEDFDFLAGYGRPFPPRYKHINIDRTVSGGEFGIEAKSLPNLDAIIARLVGAKYEAHGIRYDICPLLTTTNAEKSYEKLIKIADIHARELVGFVTIGYDTPGYGHAEKDANGSPKLMKYISKLASEFEVPYIVDSASCLPVIGLAPKNVKADVMMWSMDKVARSTICGLIVGTEEVMLPIRKGLGLGGHRFGAPISHYKAVFSFADPGRDSLIGLMATLQVLKDKPELFTRPIDKMHTIVKEEFKSFTPSRFRDTLIITKSYNYGGIELNYEQTWQNNEFGIPIFSGDDMYTNTNPIMSALDEMGVYPATIYTGNSFISPGLGTLDEDGELIEEDTRLAVRALVRALEIVCKYAGLTE